MDVGAEAKRVMVQALSKMYSSRSARGGLRLHRSLLLTLVMKSARDIYHSVRGAGEGQGKVADPPSEVKPMDSSDPEATAESPARDQENRVKRQSRKRPGKKATEPDFLPCKRARMDSGDVLKVLQGNSLRGNSGKCGREKGTVPNTFVLMTVVTC